MEPLTSGNSGIAPDQHQPVRPLRILEDQQAADLTAEARALADALLRRERARWAYEIHDGLTQSVAAAILQLEMLSRRIQVDPVEAADDLAETAAEMRTAMADIRSILFNLSADDTDDAAPTEQVRACVDDVAGRWKLDASLAIDGDLLGVPSAVLAIGQVVIHEALTNAAKHADGAGVEVSVTVDATGFTVSISDHGAGMGENARRFGMRMMERRVTEQGGSLAISSDDTGTQITATFPREDWR